MTRPYHLCCVDSMRSWGGAEVWLLETLTELDRRGHRVSVVAQPGSALLARAREAGLAVAAIPIRCDGAPWTIWRLWRHFRRTAPTVVLANLMKDLKAAAVAGRLAGVPRVLGTWESDFPLKDKFYYRWYLNRVASGLVVASEATRATILGSAPWLAPARVLMLPKGIDMERFHPAQEPPQVPTVGFAGQFVVRKGLRELMAAWSAVDAADRADGARLLLAGDGALADEVASWRDRLQHPDRVELRGWVEDPADFHRELSVLAMPSHAEGFGLAAAEAAACGVPVVAARASSLPEIVSHGRTGLLVPPGDGPALAAALTALLDDPDHARRLGAAGRRRVLEHFPRERTLARLLELTGAEERQEPCTI